jgi:hypothetical protein
MEMGDALDAAMEACRALGRELPEPVPERPLSAGRPQEPLPVRNLKASASLMRGLSRHDGPAEDAGFLTPAKGNLRTCHIF